MSSPDTSHDTWPFEVIPSLLNEKRQQDGLWHVGARARIKQPLVVTGHWIVAGDEEQGYGLHLRDYEGAALPELPLPPAKVRDLQLSFSLHLTGYEILYEFTAVRNLWLVEAEKLPDLNFLAAMPELEFFKLRNMEGMLDLSPMRNHKKLRKLDWWGPYEQETISLSCLDGCDALEILHFIPKVLVDDPDELITRFPKLRCVRGQFECPSGDGGVSVLDRLRQARPEVIITDEYYVLNSVEW